MGEVTVYGTREGDAEWEELGWEPVSGQWEFTSSVDLPEAVECSCFRFDFDIDLLGFHGYLAKATARVSRMTVILICPG